jgi:hypothetical protein
MVGMYNTFSLFYELVKKENLSNLDQFIVDFQTFEEIPLISRVHHVKHYKKIFSEEEFQLFLINAAVFILNNVIQHARKSGCDASFFACLTFSFDDIEEFGYAIPDFLVTRKIELFYSLKTKKETTVENLPPILSQAFLKTGTERVFQFIESIIEDPCGDMVGAYAIPRNSPLFKREG